MPLLKLTQRMDESDLYLRFEKDDIVEMYSTEYGEGKRFTTLDIGNESSYEVLETPDEIMAELQATCTDSEETS